MFITRDLCNSTLHPRSQRLENSHPKYSEQKIKKSMPVPNTSPQNYKYKRNLILDQPEQLQFVQPQDTPKFKTHRKTGSYGSAYSNSSTATKKFQPQFNFFLSPKQSNSENKGFYKIKKQSSMELSIAQFDRKTVKSISKQKNEKIQLESNRQNFDHLKTERKIRWKNKAQMIEKLQRKLQDLDKLVNQMDIIKISSESDKHIKVNESYQNKNLRYSSKTIKVNENKTPKSKNSLTLKDFIIVTRKGKGRFGEVYLALHCKTGTLVALKLQKKSQLRKNNMIERFIFQTKIQSYLNHPNICKLYGVFDDDQDIFMVMEYMHDGSLYAEMKKYKKFEQKEASLKISNICSAIAQLHSNNIIHRDIKPQNIVVNMGVYKLCDFGWSVVENERRQTYCGTFDYVPPQILKGQKYNFSIDLWQLGVLSYQILTGQLPFYHNSRKQTFLRITNFSNTLAFPRKTSKEAINFICQLLRKNPEQRRPASEIRYHPFIKKYKQNVY